MICDIVSEIVESSIFEIDEVRAIVLSVPDDVSDEQVVMAENDGRGSDGLDLPLDSSQFLLQFLGGRKQTSTPLFLDRIRHRRRQQRSQIVKLAPNGRFLAAVAFRLDGV